MYLRIKPSHIVPAFDTLPPVDFDHFMHPQLFAQVTDMHVTEFSQESQANLIEILKVVDDAQPDLIFATGDLQDGFSKPDFPKYGTHHKEDWMTYHEIVKDYNRSYYIEVPGNHDDFGTATFDGDANYYFRDYVHKDEDEYYVKRYDYNNFVILSFYTIGFPHSHDISDFWAEPTNRILNLVEEALESVPDDKELIILNHFPLNWHLERAKSDSGKNFNQLIEPCKARLYLSGHVHAEDSMIYHHPKFVEMCTSDVRYHKKGAYITYDNQRFVFTEFTSTKPPTFLITNPVPYSQLSPTQPGIGPNEPIRVLAFGAEEPTLQVTGDVEGQMQCTRMEPHWVCELPMGNLTSGIHHITVNGERTVEFTTANHVDSFEESAISLEDPMPFLVALIAAFIYLAIILIPYPDIFSDTLDGFDRWIDGTEEATSQYWFFAIVMSVFVLKHRIKKLPTYIQWTLLFIAAYPLALPMLIMEVEGNLGFLWSYGYYVLGQAMPSQWGFINSIIYLGIAVCPMVFFASMTSHEKWSNSFIYDIIISVIFLFIHSFLMVKFTIRIVSGFYAMISPSSVLLLVIGYSLLIAYRFIMHGKAKQSRVLDSRSLISQSSTFSYVQ